MRTPGRRPRPSSFSSRVIATGDVDPNVTSLISSNGSTYDTIEDQLIPSSTLLPPSERDEQLTDSITYKVYHARWHMLMIFCLLTFTNAFLWIGFAPIVELTEKYYNISSTWVNLLSAIFMIMYTSYIWCISRLPAMLR